MKYMKKAKRTILLPLVAVILMGMPVSCGHSASEIADIVSERDSLRNASAKQQRNIDRLTEAIEVVNGSIVSIVTQEDALFVSSKSEGGPATKEEVLENVAKLEKLISDQKEKIAELENNLSSDGNDEADDTGTAASLRNLIAGLRKQIAQKDNEIAKLKGELQKKDVDISRLQAQAAQQSQRIADLDRRATMQQEALKRQDAMLNQCYMAIGSKKDLQNKGIIKKGKIMAQNALDRTKFSKVDIRKLTEITFSAKRPKILTSMPGSSYEMTTDGRGSYTLTIKNPTAFWSVSNYLVIQTD